MKPYYRMKALLRRVGYGKPGIPKESEYGRLVLTQWSPETNEIFVLREETKPLGEDLMSRATRAKVPQKYHEEAKEQRVLSLLRLKRRGEERLGYARYLPLKENIYVNWLEVEGRHRKRNVASSLLAYLKTHGKDIRLQPKKSAEGFYTKLGFRWSKQPHEWSYGGLVLSAKLVLPAKEKLGAWKFLVKR